MCVWIQVAAERNVVVLLSSQMILGISSAIQTIFNLNFTDEHENIRIILTPG